MGQKVMLVLACLSIAAYAALLRRQRDAARVRGDMYRDAAVRLERRSLYSPSAALAERKAGA